MCIFVTGVSQGVPLHRHSTSSTCLFGFDPEFCDLTMRGMAESRGGEQPTINQREKNEPTPAMSECSPGVCPALPEQPRRRGWNDLPCTLTQDSLDPEAPARTGSTEEVPDGVDHAARESEEGEVAIAQTSSKASGG